MSVKEEEQDEHPKRSKVSTPAKNTRSTARGSKASALAKNMSVAESSTRKRKGSPMVVVKNSGQSPNKKIRNK